MAASARDAYSNMDTGATDTHSYQYTGTHADSNRDPISDTGPADAHIDPYANAHIDTRRRVAYTSSITYLHSNTNLAV